MCFQKKRCIAMLLAVLALMCCLTGCNFTKQLSGALAHEAESTPKAEEMMEALAENSLTDAKALLHPDADENSDAAIAQMSDYLAGRKVRSMELKNINVNTSAGTSGNTRQEKVSYQVTLTDGAVIYVSLGYLSNRDGAGFTSFQLVLGIV